MKTITFIISHRPDNRYIKRFRVLSGNFNINLIFWNKTNTRIDTNINNVNILEIHIPANQTNPLKRIPETVLFLRKAYKELLKTDSDYVYVGNLDMLYIARKYKLKKDLVKIIYEIADLHRLIIDEQKGIKKLLRSVLKLIEKKYIQLVDILVLTSMKFYDVYYKELIDRNKVVFLPNMPEESTFYGYIPKERTGKPFTIGFIGWIRYKEQLKMLIDAAKETGIHVLFAGSDSDGIAFEEYCKNFPFVSFLGTFDYGEKIRELYDQIDCVYAVYDADMNNVRIALPNKLYEAIKCEKPIIVSKGTYLSELVKTYGVGVEVGHHDKANLVDSILRLKNDKEYYEELVCNERKIKKDINLSKYNDCLIHAIETL